MEKLKVGGFGTIYKSNIGNKPIIIKEFKKYKNQKTTIIKEINFLYLLKGFPHICQILDCSMEKITITLQLYSGSLREFMNLYPLEKRTKNIKDKFVMDILSGIYFINSRGILHGDIKPDNILYDFKGGNYNFYYSDFGVSTINNCNPKYRTPNPNFTSYLLDNYKAPEVFKKIYTEKSEMWAIGILILEFLASKSIYNILSLYFYNGLLESNGLKVNEENIEKIKKNKEAGFKFNNYKIDDCYKNLLEKIFKLEPEYRISPSSLKNCIELLGEKITPINFLPIDGIKIPKEQIEFIIETLFDNKKDNYIVNKIITSVDIFLRYINNEENVSKKEYDLISCSCMYLAQCLFDFKDNKDYSYYVKLGNFTEDELIKKINKIFKKLNYIISNCDHDKIIFELKDEDKKH